MRISDSQGQAWVVEYDTSVVQNTAYPGKGQTQHFTDMERYPVGAPEQKEPQYHVEYSSLGGEGQIEVFMEEYENTPFFDPPPGGAPTATGATVVYRNDPTRRFRYNLESGDSYEQSYRVDKSYPLFPIPIPDSSMVMSTIEYVGRESVTVSAGSFETCRFDEQRLEEHFEEGPSMVNAKTWIAVSNGIVVRRERDGEFHELLSATINGVPLAGR